MNSTLTSQLVHLWRALHTTFCAMARIHNQAPWRTTPFC
jgi:hypothetical protein